MKRAFENRLNVLLSDLLCQIGIISRAEFIHKGRRDVVVYHQGLAIVLEGSYSRSDAENDAKKRIEQLDTDIAIAIHYPSVFPQTLGEYEIKQKLRKIRFPVRIIVSVDISGTLFEILHKKNVIAKPIEDWYDFDLNTLATLIHEVGQFIIGEESLKKAEDDVGTLIQSFVHFLTTHKESKKIADNLYGVLYKLYGFSIGNPDEIKEALFAQSSLAILLSSIYYESIRYIHKLGSLENLARGSHPQQALEKATYDILRINYEPIFEATAEMIGVFPPMPRLFGNLIQVASWIASKRTLLRRDLAGKVYHKVVGDWSLKKGLATFFTQIPSAYLLLYLAKPKLCRISDFACGSGTLLVAAYSAANAHYRLSLLKEGVDKNPKEIEQDFHISFLNSCYGFDVLQYATQITALNLALHCPETPFQEFHIFTLPLGYREEDAIISLGSLELVKPEVWHKLSKAIRIGINKKEEKILEELQALEPFDLIVMNPPFARTTGRGGKKGGGLFGFMSDEKLRKKVLVIYKQLRDEAKDNLLILGAKILKDANLEFLLVEKEFQPFRNVWQAGEGFVFLYLAHRKLKKDGKICFVLPKGLLSGTSWFLARVLLASKYHIEYLIVSFDSENGYNFSESTSLSECLLIAKQNESQTDKDETNFVILLRKPHTSIEAIALAERIQYTKERVIEVGNAAAFIAKVKRKELLQNLDNWGKLVSFPNIELIEEVNALLSGSLKIGTFSKEIPLTRLNELCLTIGVDRHRFTDTFKVLERYVPGGLRILHGGEEELRMRMEISANAYVYPIIERAKIIYKEKSGKLLVPNRIRVNTAHIISLLSNEPILSNIFYAIRLKEETGYKPKALCFWLNTSWGILTILASREETEGAWIELNQSHWRLLPVLNINELHEKEVKELASLFDKFKLKNMPRIPQQYGVTGKPNKVRMEFDLAFLKVMGISVKSKELLPLYELIASSLKQWLG